MPEIETFYFKNDNDWRDWLHNNHTQEAGIYVIFYKIGHVNSSMRWEEAVQVALCYGWIDSTVKSLGNGKRRQYFCQRKAKSSWNKINKDSIKELKKKGLMHKSGLQAIAIAKKNGSWSALNEVEKGVVPEDLEKAFYNHPLAFENYKNFTKSQRKSYLYWLNQAKREVTRQKRIAEIVSLCAKNLKSRG